MVDIVSYVLGKNSGGGGGDAVIVSKSITENGVYAASADSADGYSPISVNVPQEEPTLQEKTTTVNGEVTPDTGYDGLSKVNVNVPAPTPSLQTKSVTPSASAQEVTADTGYDGLEQVNVAAIGEPYADLNDYIITTKSSRRNTANSIVLEMVTHLPSLNLNGITSYKCLFNGCSQLLEVPNITNSSNVTDYTDMFSGCSSLTTIPVMDTSNGTTFQQMFSGCSSLTTIPVMDTSNGTNFSSIFYGCINITSIPQLNFENANMLGSIFAQAILKNFTSFGGFLNLGNGYSTTQAANYAFYTFNLSCCTKLSHDSLMNVINGLYDIATKGCNAQRLTLGTTNLAKLTATEIAIATTKGWTVT